MSGLFKFLLFLSYISPLFSQLEEPLQDNGGYHFRFEGSRYVITMNVLGTVYFTSKKLEQQNKSEAFKQRIYLSYASRDTAENNYKVFKFNKMETESKQSSSKFTLLIRGEMETGVKVIAKIEGNKSKVILSTGMTCPDKVSFSMAFHVPQALPELQQKGILMKLSQKGEKFAHACKTLYESKHYSVSCRQVLVQNRNPLDLVFDSGKAEGYFRVVQYSHNQGSDLNNSFSIHYHNWSKNWDINKNSFVFSF